MGNLSGKEQQEAIAILESASENVIRWHKSKLEEEIKKHGYLFYKTIAKYYQEKKVSEDG